MSGAPDGRVAAVVLAGGSGTRFGGSVSKVYAPLGGRPVLARSLEVLDASALVDDVVVVIREGDRSAYDATAAVAPTAKVRSVVPGGASRQASEWQGITAVARQRPEVAWVVLHDAARPFLTLALLADLLTAARANRSGSLPARRLAPDLVRADGTACPVADLVAVQTPQVFPLQTLLDAYPRAQRAGFDGVDTAQTVQAHSDLPVHWVPAGPPNPKITHPEDLAAAEALLPGWDGGRWRH